MMLRLVSAALLPAAVLSSGCARHIGKPETPQPARVERSYSVQRDQLFTPPNWPKALLADVYTPSGAPPSGDCWPAVLVIHGGGWKSGDREQVESLAERVAKRGYVAVNITYRLVPDALFPAPVEDVQQAVRWLRANAERYQVDPTRIGAWGYSAGAHLAALVGGLSPGDRLYAEDARLKVVVAGGIPSDLRKFHGGTLVPNFLGEHWSENSVAFRESSPAAYVTAGDPPVFLYHGTWDMLVPLDQSLDYQAALDAAGVPNELYLLRGLGHIAAFLMDGAAVQRGADFLDRHLR
ncbi:alpha/beta hydrolase fold domain-containing protein [Nevskia ramosa]|uniref:alpha/beta hydrolase fold domain-containing protein n=1 Tax=Nevskia ramosa TaxID=64002 RepID=UPI003D0989E4